MFLVLKKINNVILTKTYLRNKNKLLKDKIENERIKCGVNMEVLSNDDSYLFM